MLMMWILSLYWFLAFLSAAVGSQSSPLPKLLTSDLSHTFPSTEYTEGRSLPLPTTVWIHTSQPQSHIKIGTAAATPTSGVLSSMQPVRPSSSKPLQPGTPTDTVCPSTVTVQSPTVLLSLTANLSMLTLPTFPVPTSPPTVPPSVATAECLYESSYSCEATYPVGCRCDELCERFGDCCLDSVYVHTYNDTLPNFNCVPNIVLDERIKDEEGLLYYWMIASCPKTDSKVTGGMADLCEVQSLSSPPISDSRTGLVYRNKYCAQCNGVPEEEHVTWPSKWNCNDSLGEESSSNGGIVDLQAFLAACNPAVFSQPQGIADRLYPVRKCDGDIIYKCQPPPETDIMSEDYLALEECCRTKPAKPMTISNASGVYKNEHCALCSSPIMDISYLQCPPQPITRNIGPPPQNTFALFLDVTGSGVTVLGQTDIQVTSMVQQSCGEGQVFDVYVKGCRESLCPSGFTYMHMDTSCSTNDSNCTLIALNATEYEEIEDQSFVIYWIAVELNTSVQGYNSEGNPLVCTNFISNFTTIENETVSRTLYGYPVGFTILSYLGLSVDVVAAAILLFTYAAFAEMRTFYGKLFMNFVLVLLLGDLTFLLGTAVYTVSLEDVVCQVVGILLHYLFLARFVWMLLLSLNVTRHFYHAMKFIVSEESESWYYLILYMAAGWLSPLLVLIVTVPVDYAIPGAIGYGVDGLCWMDQTLAIIMTFIIPLVLCILFTTGACVFVCIIMVRLHSSEMNMDHKHKTVSRNCRVLVAVFCITGVTWVFGLLAQIDAILSWAWYLFIILSTTQAVFLTLAYVCTAKVLRLYRTALTKIFQTCGRKCRSKLHIVDEPTQLEIIKSMRSNTAESLLVSNNAHTRAIIQTSQTNKLHSHL